MPVFYLLHSSDIWSKKQTNGQKNSKTFLFGMFIYSLIYIITFNLYLKGSIDRVTYDAIYFICIVMFLSDVAVVGYTYRSYYGRSLLNEVGEIADITPKDNKWQYDKNTDTYIRKPNDKEIQSDVKEIQPDGNLVSPKKSIVTDTDNDLISEQKIISVSR